VYDRWFGAPAKFLWFLCLMPTLVGFDWATKDAVRTHLPVGEEVQVINGWLSIFHAENPHAAFSMPVPMPVLLLVGVVALGVMLHALWQLPRNARLGASAIALVMAGAIGNLVDRFTDGSVTDFVRVYTEHPDLAPWLVHTFGTATWPIFNVADVAILGGASLFLLGSFVSPDDDDQNGEDSAVMSPGESARP
jgi:signal peptidase II